MTSCKWEEVTSLSLSLSSILPLDCVYLFFPLFSRLDSSLSLSQPQPDQAKSDYGDSYLVHPLRVEISLLYQFLIRSLGGRGRSSVRSSWSWDMAKRPSASHPDRLQQYNTCVRWTADQGGISVFVGHRSIQIMMKAHESCFWRSAVLLSSSTRTTTRNTRGRSTRRETKSCASEISIEWSAVMSYTTKNVVGRPTTVLWKTSDLSLWSGFSLSLALFLVDLGRQQS